MSIFRKSLAVAFAGLMVSASMAFAGGVGGGTELPSSAKQKGGMMQGGGMKGGAMKGGAMKGGAMKGGAMKGGAMKKGM